MEGLRNRILTNTIVYDVRLRSAAKGAQETGGMVRPPADWRDRMNTR